MCIYDYMHVKGRRVSKIFEDEFLQEVVKSYWLAKFDLFLASWPLRVPACKNQTNS